MFEVVSGLVQLLWGTLWLRPYVFIFLVVYLWLGTWHLGWARILLFLAAGYSVAWLSEFSSIHTGFPYGLYIYIPATQDRELWVLGVPFMDSLSYVFLSYASYSLALLLLAVRRPSSSGQPVNVPIRPLAVVLLAAVLFVTLDIIIDPLALRGYRWFLGQIYGYPEPAVYFGIPLSNFAGWFVVGMVLITLLHRLAGWHPRAVWFLRGQQAFPEAPYLGSLLYFGVLGFNLFMTFWIGEILLGLIDVIISLPVAVLAGAAWRQMLSARPILKPLLARLP